MKILILGGGNMGLTYAQCFLRSRIVTSDNAMIEAAKQMGFSPSEAELLVGQTFTGAIGFTTSLI